MYRKWSSKLLEAIRKLIGAVQKSCVHHLQNILLTFLLYIQHQIDSIYCSRSVGTDTYVIYIFIFIAELFQIWDMTGTHKDQCNGHGNLLYLFKQGNVEFQF